MISIRKISKQKGCASMDGHGLLRKICIRRPKIWIFGGGIVMLAVLFGLVSQQNRGREKKLMIAAAASLKPAMEELMEMYRKKHPNITLFCSYGSSGTLEQQIRQGAPIDLFISAAASNMDSLSREGLIIDRTRIDLLENKLVLIEPADSMTKLSGFEDLPKYGKIAIGDPDFVPAGKYAYEVCNSLGIWGELENKLIYGKDVTEVLTWVAFGNADAGMVYSTEVSLSVQVRVVAFAPEGSHSRIVYPAALVKGCKDEKAGTDFIGFLKSAEAGEVFVKYGFITVN